jgi:hypothetical protein
MKKKKTEEKAENLVARVKLLSSRKLLHGHSKYRGPLDIKYIFGNCSNQKDVYKKAYLHPSKKLL